MSHSQETKAPPPLASEDWSALPWRKLERHVYRLQKRIYRASERGNHIVVHRLQQLLMRSQSARLLAVRRVTQDNQGKHTAGIDGVKSLAPAERLTLAEAIHPKHQGKRHAQPVRRVWIPKPGKTDKRPLGIPTMKNRAEQALARQALEPEWEARFEPNSYGFRPGRSCHDAIEAIFSQIKHQAKYALDADIRGCFDHLSHQALLEKLATYPAMRQAVKGWLKAGIMEEGQFSPTEEGAPQGGCISPLLANIALDGMEAGLHQAFTRREGKPALVRYADDFVVLHPTLEGVTKARMWIEQWLSGIGLELNPKKTSITHTLTAYEGRVGFDFLGFTVRQFPAGKTHSGKNGHGTPLGFKTLIKPSQEAVKAHMRALKAGIRKLQNAPQGALIGHLNPIVRGWSNYNRTKVAKDAFRRCDHLLYKQLRAWARRRHPNKTPGWIARKYWALDTNAGWTFTAPDKNVLIKHMATPIRRHTKVRGTASPYDGNLLYWAQRLQTHPMLRSRVGALLKLQQGKCAYCGLTLRDGDLLEVDHIIPRSLGGKDEWQNLQLMHRHCHDQKTATYDALLRASRAQRP